MIDNTDQVFLYLSSSCRRHFGPGATLELITGLHEVTRGQASGHGHVNGIIIQHCLPCSNYLVDKKLILVADFYIPYE